MVLSDKFIRKHNGDEISTAPYLSTLAGRPSIPVALFLFKRLSSFSIKILIMYWKMNLGDTVSLILGGLHQIKSLSKSEFLSSVEATFVKKEQNVFEILMGSQTFLSQLQRTMDER